jgi:hypothetical protein
MPYGGGGGATATGGPTQTIDFTGAAGMAPSQAVVYGPTLTATFSLAVGTAPSTAAVYGPTLGLRSTILVGGVPTRPAVFAPEVSGPPTLTDAQQVVALPGATGGTVTLTFDGQTTAPIAWNASATDVQTALLALANLAPGDVVVTMGPWPAAVVVTFGGAYAGLAVPLLVLDTTNLVGGGGVVTVARTGGLVRPRLTAWAMDRTNPAAPVAELTTSRARRVLPELNAPGEASLTLPHGSPAAGSVGYFDLVQFRLDERVEFTAVVRKRTRAVLAQGEESAQGTVLSGPGVMDLLRSGVVLPYGGIGSTALDRRVFNFASMDYDDSGWGYDVVETGVFYVDNANNPIAATPPPYPNGWKDPDAKWVWDRFAGYGGVPGGDCYFRTRFTTVVGTQVEVQGAADDAYELWIDGQLVVSDLTTGVFLGQMASTKLYLPAGDHVVGMFARNTTPGLKAGALWSVLQLDAAGAVVNVLARSSGMSGTPEQWPTRILPYPAEPPGFTWTKVLRLLLTEAQARGTCTTISRGFDDTAYTNGAAVPTTANIAFPIGATLLDVLRQGMEGYFDARMTPQLLLEIHGAIGGARAVPLVGGPGTAHGTANLTELVHEGVV